MADSGSAAAGPLEVGVGPARRIVVPTLLMMCPLFIWLVPPDSRLVPTNLFLACVAAVAMVFQLVRRSRLRALGCLVRIDEAGVTVRGERTVAWTELASVTRPKKYPGTLVFVPAPGAPPLPLMLATGTDPDRRRTRLTKRFGSPLVLFTTGLDADADTVVAAVDRFSGGLPIRPAAAPAPLDGSAPLDGPAAPAAGFPAEPSDKP